MKRNFRNLTAYQIISDHYGDRTAVRSGVQLIEHINEGCDILEELNAPAEVLAAFMLHPIYQDDRELVANWNKNFYIEPKVMVLVMEYRRVANAYLSKREINILEDIELSPLLFVNLMLYADKVQNQKDFLIYHKGTHERSDILDQYFKNWLERLEPLVNAYKESVAQ